MTVDPHAFPSYTPAERRADIAVHVLGVGFALVGGTWLAATAGSLPVLVYVLGLVGMTGASAAYNLAPPGPAKAILRRIDHAMILVMIAGSYTPFAALLMPPRLGLPLSAAVWGLAAIGMAMAVTWPRQLQRWGMLLYLGTGWLLLPLLGPISDALPQPVLELLVAGGLVYSAGAAVHLMRGLPYHNAVWHAFVLAGALLHFRAVTLAFP